MVSSPLGKSQISCCPTRFHLWLFSLNNAEIIRSKSTLFSTQWIVSRLWDVDWVRWWGQIGNSGGLPIYHFLQLSFFLVWLESGCPCRPCFFSSSGFLIGVGSSCNGSFGEGAQHGFYTAVHSSQIIPVSASTTHLWDLWALLPHAISCELFTQSICKKFGFWVLLAIQKFVWWWMTPCYCWCSISWWLRVGLVEPKFGVGTKPRYGLRG